MKTTILAAAAALTLALGAAQAFAASQQGASHDSGTNVYNRCAAILADAQSNAKSDVEYCRAQS